MSLSSMNHFSPVPLVEGDQDQSHLPSFTLASDSSSCLCSILFNTSQERGANYGVHHILQQEPNEHLFIRKSSDHLITFPTSYNNNTTTTTNGESCHHRDSIHLDDPTKWMSSKMRFRRKMMNSDHVVMSRPRRNMRVVEDRVHSNQDSSMRSSSNNGSSSSGFIRVCSNCSTTKTPLWRSGPRGPKSLCNACGIRHRKARRAMDAAAAAASGGLIPGEVPGKVRKERRSVVDRTTATQNKKLCFDDVMVSLSKSSAVHRVFSQDERDAALLLMALSWGIVCS